MKKLGPFFIFAGAFMMALSVGFLIRNIFESNNAGDMSKIVVQELAIRIEQNLNDPNMNEPKEYKGLENTAEYGLDDTSNQNEHVDSKEMTTNKTENTKIQEDTVIDVETYDAIVGQMPTEEIDGNQYIGVIETKDFCLPVMNSWDYDKLKISPCRYAGSYLTDNLVICGHNYATHFSPVKWMHIGDEVDFTTVTGKSYHYVVSNIETIEPEHITQMTGTSDWQLTLFTCNTGGLSRCAIRCQKVR
jgi:sortase A